MHVFWIMMFCLLPGDEALQVLEPGSTGISGETLTPYVAHYTEYQGETKQGMRIVTLEQANFPAGLGWRAVIAMIGNDTVYDSFRFLASDFSHQVRMISCGSLLHQFEVFGSESVSGVKVDGKGNTPQPVSMEMQGNRFPNGTLLYVLAGQTLAKDQTYLIPVFSSDMGAAAANGYQKVTVLGREKLTAKDGKTYQTWVLSRTMLDSEQKPLEMGGRPFPEVKTWMTTTAPYQIRTDYGSFKQIWLSAYVETPKANY